MHFKRLRHNALPLGELMKVRTVAFIFLDAVVVYVPLLCDVAITKSRAGVA